MFSKKIKIKKKNFFSGLDRCRNSNLLLVRNRPRRAHRSWLLQQVRQQLLPRRDSSFNRQFRHFCFRRFRRFRLPWIHVLRERDRHRTRGDFRTRFGVFGLSKRNHDDAAQSNLGGCVFYDDPRFGNWQPNGRNGELFDSSFGSFASAAGNLKHFKEIGQIFVM